MGLVSRGSYVSCEELVETLTQLVSRGPESSAAQGKIGRDPVEMQ